MGKRPCCWRNGPGETSLITLGKLLTEWKLFAVEMLRMTWVNIDPKWQEAFRDEMLPGVGFATYEYPISQ